MKLLFAISLACLLPAQDSQKPLPPDESSSTELVKELQSLDWYPDPESTRLQSVASALKIGQQAAQEKNNDRAWAIYQLAIKQADAASENRISHSLALEIADKWNVPKDFMLQWFTQATKRTTNEARITELVMLMADDVKRLGPDDVIEDWEKAFKDMRWLAGSAKNERSKEACSKPLDQIKAGLWIAKEADSKDAQAFRLILSGKVLEGIKQLESSENSELAAAAQSVSQKPSPDDEQDTDKEVEPQSNDSVNPTYGRLFELLANLKMKAANLAGQRIFESLVPRLTKEQIESWQPICYFMSEPLPVSYTHLTLPTNREV